MGRWQLTTPTFPYKMMDRAFARVAECMFWTPDLNGLNEMIELKKVLWSCSVDWPAQDL